MTEKRNRVRPVSRPASSIAIVAAVGALVLAATPAGAAIISGDGADNVLFGTGQGDAIDGRGGNDLLFGQGGHDVVRGGPDGGFGDRVFGGFGIDVLQGDAGFDRIYSQDGRSETLSGGEDRDVIFAADSDDDSIDCGAGDDSVVADAADRVTDCEEVVTVTGVFGGVAAEIGTEGDDRLTGEEQVFGKGGNDVLRSRVPDAIFYPGPGRDVVDGEPAGRPGFGGHEVIDDDGARDVIRSGPGNDLIYSAGRAAVRDVIDCGAGSDKVYADHRDVLENCEQVIRRGPSA